MWLSFRLIFTIMVAAFLSMSAAKASPSATCDYDQHAISSTLHNPDGHAARCRITCHWTLTDGQSYLNSNTVEAPPGRNVTWFTDDHKRASNSQLTQFQCGL
jgi:hypothetical protein